MSARGDSILVIGLGIFILLGLAAFAYVTYDLYSHWR